MLEAKLKNELSELEILIMNIELEIVQKEIELINLRIENNNNWRVAQNEIIDSYLDKNEFECDLDSVLYNY